jgi:hypothetical protein
LVSLVCFGTSSAWADPTLTASKTAQVIGGASGDGTATNPIPVNIGDVIEYTVSVTRPVIPVPTPSYDVLFVLDWSRSLNAGYDDGQTGTATSDDAWSARRRAESTVRTLSQQIFAAYPGSRIALMGFNSNDRNTSQKGDTYIQVDTNFVGPSDYVSVIQNAYASYPYLTFDDISVFMQAGVDKLRGAAVTYGGNASKYSTEPAAPAVTIKPRTDKTRIPVMVVISDFEIGMGNFGVNPVTGGSWSTVTQSATNFKTEFPHGILLAARADSQENTVYNAGIFATPTHDARMAGTFSYVAPGDTVNSWGWVKFEKNQTQAYQDSLLFNLIKAKAPPPSYPSTVTELLPAGLQYVSSQPGGTRTTVTGRDRVVWTNTDLPAGNIVYKVRARVTDYGLFVNTATVAVGGLGSVTTNPTYHKATPPPTVMTLHIRQIVINRTTSIPELPPMGYMTLSNAGVVRNVTTNSGVDAGIPTDFTQYIVTTAISDPIFVVVDILPQYYSYEGYVDTTTEVTHNPAVRLTGTIGLDFTDEHDYWVTVYISPRHVPGDYAWDFATNDFGKIVGTSN